MTIDEFKEKYGWDPTSSEDMSLNIKYAMRKSNEQQEEERVHRMFFRNNLRIKFNDNKEANTISSKFSLIWNDILADMNDLENNCQPSYFTWLKSLKILSLSSEKILILYTEDIHSRINDSYSNLLKDDLSVIICKQIKLLVMQKEEAKDYLGISQNNNISECMVENEEIRDIL